MGFTSLELNPARSPTTWSGSSSPSCFTGRGLPRWIPWRVELPLRVWLDPAKMAAFDLTSSDVMTVLNSNNYQSATGQATGYFTLFNGNAETQVGNIEEPAAWWSPPATAR